MQTVTVDNIFQFTYGCALLLPFKDLRASSLTPIDNVEETWQVVIWKPNGASFEKHTGVFFPVQTTPAIAVPISSGDLEQKGTYSYQVIRTTGSVSIRSEVETFDVKPSLPTLS